MWQTWLDQLLNGPFGPIAVALGIGGLLILLAYGVYQLNLYLIKRGTHPAIIEVLNQAIALAWQASERAIDAGMDRLHGLDKKRIADSLYDEGGELLMQLQLRFLPIQIDLRRFVTREKWALFVQARFDDMTGELQEILDRMESEGPPWTEMAVAHTVPRPPTAQWPCCEG